MRVKTILGVALIAVMSIACGKPDVVKVDPAPQEPQMLYVKAIKAYNGMPGYSDYDSSVVFDIDSEKRIASMRSTWLEDGVEVSDPEITFTYGEGTAVINYSYDGESGSINCELNDKGAITRAVYGGEMMGFVEEFAYNDDGELESYAGRYGNMDVILLTYEWKNGNIYKVSYGDMEESYTFTHEYTAEANIYNIDIFHGCTFACPILCEFVAVNDGLFGKKNHNFLKTVYFGDQTIPVFDYKFKANGELEYATMGEEGYMVFECFQVL